MPTNPCPPAKKDRPRQLHPRSWLEIVRPPRIFRITSSSSSPWDSWRLVVAKFTAISRCWASWHGKIHNIQALPSILCGNWAEGWRPISCLFAKVSSCRQASVKLAVRLVKFRTICSKMAWNFEMAVIRFVSVVELPYYYWWIFKTDSVSHSVARTLVDPLVVSEITKGA